MKRYDAQHIRNVGLFSHGGAGKTSLAEALLYAGHATSRLGRVEDGTTVSDWDPDEIKRGISISTSVLPIEWNDHKINVLDAPGYADFFGEVKCAMRVCDTALILIDAAAGVEVGTEQAWKAADEVERPRAFFINRMDRENANFARSLEAAQQAFGPAVVPLQMPIGAEREFSGIIDLLGPTAYQFTDDREGKRTPIDIPGDLRDAVEQYRTQLIERICETQEDLMLRYLDDDDISVEDFRSGLRSALAAGQIAPVFVGAATTLRGVDLLLDAFVSDFPPPQPTTATATDGATITLEPDPSGPLAALIFKTIADPFVGKLSYFRVYSGTMRSDSHVLDVQRESTERIGQLYVVRGKEQIATTEIPAGDIGAVAKLQSVETGDTLTGEDRPLRLDGITFPEPAFSAAVHPKTKSDLDKMGSALQRLLEEDPTLRFSRDATTGEPLIAGLGESHVQISLERMARKFGVEVETGLPRVAYRETITAPVRGVEYKHKKQTGGHGQYGHVFLDIEPYPDGPFAFEERVVGGVVPKQFIPAVEKGVREALQEGVLAGYPVTNVKVTLTDGSYHPVDSSEMAFKLAASQAFKKGVLAAKPCLLEPIMRLRVTVPEAHMGDVMSDLNSKRAHVQGMAPDGDGLTTIEALAPAAEIQRYATELRSITQGRGSFTATFDHYEQVPAHIAEGIIAAAKRSGEPVQA